MLGISCGTELSYNVLPECVRHITRAAVRADAGCASTVRRLPKNGSTPLFRKPGRRGSYQYVYVISNGTWVGSGDIDEGFQGFKYGPRLGAYVRESHDGYRYNERGWVFDTKGNNVGIFRSEGTFLLSSDGTSFSGPGTFTQSDRRGKSIIRERFVAKATTMPIVSSGDTAA
jgi:hypothetical protein